MDDRLSLVRRAAFFGAVIATVAAPLQALARYATADGKGDLELPLTRVWAEPAAEFLRSLLDWAGADTVYLTYGKVWAPVLLAALLCAWSIRREREPQGGERWGWRLSLTGYGLATAGAVGSYWTPLLDESFVALSIPGLLLSLVGSAALGVSLLRRGFAPRSTAWLLVLWVPLFAVATQLVAFGGALLPMLWAWALAARARLSPDVSPVAHPVS